MAFSLKEKLSANYAKGEFPALHDDQAIDDSLELDLTRPALQQPTLELDLSTQQPRKQCGSCVSYKNTVCLVGANPNKNSECDSFQQWKQDEAALVLGEIEMTRPAPSEKTAVFPRSPVETQNLASLPSIAEFSAVKLAEELGYTEILTVGALEDGIRFYQQRTAEACLELGKRLLLLKELSAHGEFLDRVKLLGFSKQSASRFMSAAHKFTKMKSPNVGLLAQTVGTQAKLLELLILDDDDIEELAKGNEANGVTLDEIECMTATELRKALRKHKAEQENQAIPEDAQEEINHLYKKIENHEKHYAQLQAEKEVADSKLKQLTTKKGIGNDLVSPETAMFREESFAFEYGARVYLDAQKRLLEKAIAEPAPNDEELLLRINSIAIAVSSTYAQIDDLFRFCQDALGTNDMPPVLSGKHVLTPEERERLEDAMTVIEHKFNLEADSREFKREQQNKRSAGRPQGAGNKPK
jgi:hypothetical protein